MASLRTTSRFRDVASSAVSSVVSAAVWASLGAALVIHGCAPSGSRTEPSVTRRPPPPAPPKQVAAVPEPVPVTPPAPPVPPKPVFEERPAVPSDEPDVRIRIAALRSAAPAVRLTNPSGTLVMHAAGAAPRSLRAPVVVKQSPTGWTVTEGVSTRRTSTLEVAGRAPVEFHPPASKGGVVGFDGTDWPGPVRIVPVADADAPGALDLVVDVSLERYLPGVLAKELIRGWDEETFRAQAIAARSFAICEHAHWAAVRHYDMVAGEASQAWVGTTKDARPREAVAATRGMVLAFDGRVVPAYYSSTCGGTPANATESLTRNPHHGIAPLMSGTGAGTANRDCCADAPKFRWQQVLSNKAMCAQLRRWANDQLDAAEPARTETAPPAGALGAKAPAATATVAQAGAAPAPAHAATATARPAAAARVASNGVTEIADAPLAAIAGIKRIASLTVVAQNAAGRPSRIRIVDDRGRVLEMRAEDFRRAVNYAREGEKPPADRLFSSAIATAAVSGDKVTLTGSGLGHGVGMCQFGAQGAAAKGVSAEAILSTYYPGAAIRRAY